MNFLLLLTFVLLVYFACYIPGRILVNILPLDYRVKFVISFGLSYFIFFVSGLLSYIFYIPMAYEFLALIIILFIVIFYQYKRHLLTPHTGESKLACIFLGAFIFVLCIQGLTPYYSGAESYWDWYEHFARSQIFLNRLPEFTRIGGYLLPQRMPLFNAAASFLTSVFGSDYWVFQTISTLFNLTVVLPCFLIAGLYLNKSVRQVALFIFIIILLLLNPSAMAMFITFTSTKALAAYYLLTGLYFLLMEFKTKQIRYIYLIMVCLGMAQLVHVVVMPYLMVIGLFLFVFSIKNKNLIHFLKASLLYLGIVSTWYIWSYKIFGWVITFVSIRNIELTANLTIGQRISLFFYNVFYSSLPLITPENLVRSSNDVNSWVVLYDRIIAFYITNIWGAVGLGIFISLIVTILIKLKHSLKLGISKIKIRLDDLLFIFFTFAGYSHFLFTATREEAGGAATMLIPTVYMLFSLGSAVIIKLASKFGKKYIYLITSFIVIEALIVIGFKLYVAKYQLDPKINTSINISRDLLSLPEHEKYSHMAVHLLNYKLKKDNNLVFLYDKFSSLQTFFLVVVAGGYIVAIYLFITSLTQLSVREGDK